MPAFRAGELTVHARGWRGQGWINAHAVLWIARCLDEQAHGFRGLRLAQQQAVHAPRQDLPELPGIAADASRVSPAHRHLDDHGRRAMPGIGRPAVEETSHILGEARHVECAMLHADVDVISPRPGIDTTLGETQFVARVLAHVIDGLILHQELNGSIDAARHDCVTSLLGALSGSTPERNPRLRLPTVPPETRRLVPQ
jgi:hypothetical protein